MGSDHRSGIGFLLVGLLDRRAAFARDAPRHFARLRGPQMAVAAVALAALLARLAGLGELGGPATGG